MEDIPGIILGIYGVAAVVVIGLIIYLIIRRINIKDKEDFEKRDN